MVTSSLICWFSSSLVMTALRTDRKRTRLNSSHLVISYAVFCLKKKKTRLNSSHLVISYAVFCLKKKITERQNNNNVVRRSYAHLNKVTTQRCSTSICIPSIVV